MALLPPSQSDQHSDHRHVQTPLKGPGRDLGMVAAIIHLFGDAVNNIGVIIVALVIWRSDSPLRFYADPIISTLIAIIIIVSAVPLTRQSGKILLQCAPDGVKLADIQHDIETVPPPFPTQTDHIPN